MLGWLERPEVKWFVPVPLLGVLAPLVWLFFRETWRQLEEDAFAVRVEHRAAGRLDLRPVAVLVMGAMILTLQDYYGRYDFFQAHLKPWILRHAAASSAISPYEELLGRCWWALTRIVGYCLPLALWRLFFRRDSLLDMGLRFEGFRAHAWVYALFVVIMVPVMLVVARQPDFGRYYPIYDQAGRSWLDFAIWEVAYIGQFFGLELFFRGWWLRGTRIFGVGAIFSMVVPYCMVHYGKPYLEACAAIVAGTVLGSLSMKTRNIWSGFLVHVTVAILMDILSLQHKGKLPTALTPGSTRVFVFTHWTALFVVVWIGALVILGLHLRRRLLSWRASRPVA